MLLFWLQHKCHELVWGKRKLIQPNRKARNRQYASAGASLSTGTTTSTSSGSGSTIEFSQGGSGLGPYYNSRLHSAVAVEPRLLSETRSTVLGALPGSDPGVDGSDEEQKPEETELEEFAEQPSLSQEMIDALVCVMQCTWGCASLSSANLRIDLFVSYNFLC